MAWNKFLTVEIPLLLNTFCFILQGAILTNLYVYRSCYVILGYPEKSCARLGNEDTNLTRWLEPQVQPTVNHINMVHSITNNLLPLLFCMFVGTWSDKFGRKPFMLLCLAGITLTTASNTIIVHFENTSPWWFTISQIPSLLTGGFAALMIVISAYMTDISTDKDRVVRLGMFEIIFGASSFFGNLSSSYLFRAVGYEVIYIIATLLAGIAFLYTLFFIPESLTHEKKAFSFKEIITSVNFKDLAKDTFKKRENNARAYIMAMLFLHVIYSLAMGEMSVNTLYLRARLGWTLQKITTVQSVTSVLNIGGTLFGTYFLYKYLKIKEFPLSLLGIVLVGVADILRAIATNDYYIYASYICNMFFGLPSLMLRTVLSYMIPPEEMGKIFALQNIIMSLDNMLSNLIYPAVYNATLDINSGIYNYLSFGIHSIVTIIIVVFSRLNFPRLNREEESPDGSKTPRKLSLTVNNIDVMPINEKRPIGRISLNIVDTRRLSQSPSIF